MQIFKLAQIYERNKNDIEFIEKYNNTLLDLSFILSKKTFINDNKLIENIMALTLSNSFVSLFTNEDNKYDFYDENQQLKFINFIKTALISFNGTNEAKLELLRINNLLTKNKAYKKLLSSINNELNN
ncbi:UNVERIFIED_CONTAM: hypothetical protein O8I53_08255 [Campylobacter lari]